MAEIFNFRPTVETPGAVRFNVLSVQFGDGYKQAAGDGVNNRTQTWNLTFRGKAAYIQQVKDFLDARKGYEPFWWTPKGESAALFEAPEYNRLYMGAGIWSLTVALKQRFDNGNP